MASRPTDKCCFKSRFAPGQWITPAQYLAENMCDRLARRDRIELPDRFWESERWGKEFVRQTVAAAKLLKEFSMEAIVAALRTTRGRQVYSLGARSILVPLIKDEQERIEKRGLAAEVNRRVEPPPRDGPPPPPEPPGRPFSSGKSLLDRLRGL